MSDRDKTALEKAGLTASQAARILSVKPQAVSQGINSPKRDYFDADRLSRLFLAVLESNPSDAKRLRTWIKSLGITIGNEIAKARLDVGEVDIEDTSKKYKSAETWVFSSQPLELSDRSCLDQMMDIYFQDPEKTIVYFAPPATARSLKGQLAYALKHIAHRQKELSQPIELAKIEIVECPAVALTPHFAILNPRRSSSESGPHGWLIVGNSRVRMTDSQLAAVMDTLFSNGIGVDPNHLVPDDEQPIETEWNELEFRSIFRSSDILAEFEESRA